MEIALKIVNKIKSNERFSAYIVIPMWPEGAPTGPFMQRILYWQKERHTLRLSCVEIKASPMQLWIEVKMDVTY
ncbi:hypothetical protein Syun_004758 [Stephania yunnanensis]|uniref:Uncharacterized protein n=1 Tax=Stephania yunnanensis TaxID=152371 RepID=A0AAP0Q597_9MAGN